MEKAEVRIRSIEYMMGAKISTGRVNREVTTACVITPLGDQWVSVAGYHAEDRWPLIEAAMDKAWTAFCNAY
jgi:hypothetical protein